MRTEFMGENPSLTALFGDEAEQAIREISAETGLSYDEVQGAVRAYAPELLGEIAAAAPGSTFANVFKGIAEGVSTAAPAVAAAIKGNQAAPAAVTTTGSSFDPMSLIIPAGIGIALLFFLLKK